MTARGSCLCKSVSYTLTMPSRFVAHCHCTICQRAHGAAFVTWVGLPESQFQLDSGNESLVTYQSSDKAQRQFCKKCGTPLFFRSSRWANEVHVALATLNEPVDKAPQAHVFSDTIVAWLNISDELPKIPEHKIR